jgi:hypothetical protein
MIKVTLTWNPVVIDCQIQYIISSDHQCGLICPNTSTSTNSTTITCSGWSAAMEGKNCTFEVRTSNICNDSLMGIPQTIQLALKGISSSHSSVVIL